MSESELTAKDLIQEPELFDGEVLSTIHHDFKNDLNLLTNYGELLASNEPNGNVVHVVSKKLAASMNALLVSLRLESGSLTPTSEPLNPIKLSGKRINWFRPLYEHLERDLTVTFDDPPDSLRTDRQCFRLILDSLLVLGSQEPEGETAITLSGTTETSPAQFTLTLRQSNPPWGIQRTPELEGILRDGFLQELVSTFSARAGLLLHTARILIETLEGSLELGRTEDDRVRLKANLRPKNPDSE